MLKRHSKTSELLVCNYTAAKTGKIPLSFIRDASRIRGAASWRLAIGILLGLIVGFELDIGASHADFATVINAPPAATADLRGIGSSTQLNLYDGATLQRSFSAGNFWTPSSNIEVNIFGGSIGDYFSAGGRPSTNTDVVVNFYDGYIGSRFSLNQGANFNMSGGYFDSELGVGPGSVANISGGTIADWLSVGTGGVLNVSAGALGEFHSQAGGQLKLSGNEFRLDGVPIAGLGSVGSKVQVNLGQEGLLTGTLADGTSIAIANQRWDYVADGSLTLEAALLPIAIPQAFHSPNGVLPRGLRAGQSLTIADGGDVGNFFTANAGSVVTMAGGDLGNGFETSGALVNISGGTVGGQASALMESVFNVSGGSIGANLYAGRGSVMNISGGSIGALFEAGDGSVVNVTGGTFDSILMTHTGSRFNISGGEFRLDGVLISGLNTPGSTRAVDFPADSVLSGTLADGTPFAFSGQDSDYFAPGTLTLQATIVSAGGTTVFHVPNDPAPRGLRTGQAMIVEEGGTVGARFNANWGTAVTINGGRIGEYFEAVGTLVNISGGSIGWGFDALYGSLVNVTGGTFEGVFGANRGSVVNISGGSLGNQLRAQSGSVVNISGGTIGKYAYAYEGSVVNLSDGTIGDSLILYGGTLNMTGGSIGDDFSANVGSALNISGGSLGDAFQGYSAVKIAGKDFRLDGAPISGLETEYAEKSFDLPVGSVLSGTLQDGTPFAFSSQDGDTLANGMLRLQVMYPAAAGPAVIQVPGSDASLGIRSGQTLFVGAGGELADNFNAGWGSTVTITGGHVGKNFEAVGAQVTIAGGTIGDNFDAFQGSAINIVGGSVGDRFDAHRGSIVNISGGLIGPSLRAEAGSEVNLFGTGFSIDGVPITNLIPGQRLTISERERSLSGRLADGSEFFFWLIGDPFSRYGFDENALLTVTSVLYGDYNGDGTVDSIDYVVWRKSLGSTSDLAADGNGDHRIDAGDYAVWRSHFGQTAGSALDVTTNAAIPEPSTILLLAGSFAVCVRRVSIARS